MSELTLDINERLRIPLADLRFQASRSSGPGGQNVNKVNTRIQMWWNISADTQLPEAAKSRFLAQNAGRLTKEGELLIESQQFRTQIANRQWCLDELARLIRSALVTPRKRRPTKPTRGSQQRRLKSKQERSEKKSRRRYNPGHE
ncbi:MAG: alternative ribosome rescue aminoacyl-tRNA hydrolase ArfB [Planctomycetaceae bacterium]